MMKRYLLIFSLLFAFFLLYHFPAQLAWSLLQKQGVDAVQLYGISGKWHSGQATAARLQGVAAHDLSWKLRPLPWRPLRLELDTGLADGGYFRGRIAAGWRGMTGKIVLREVEARLPLKLYAAQLERYGLALDGVVNAQLSRLELVGGWPQWAAGVVGLEALKALEPLPLELGDFQAAVDSDSEGVRLELGDGGGPLALEGVITLAPDRGYTLTAGLTPRDPQNRDLAMVLGFLGPPDRDGTIRIERNGQP